MYFARIGADLANHFSELGSKCEKLNVEERMRIFHNFYRVGEKTSFHFDIKENIRKGHSFKDFICPDSFKIQK